jgi:hypothetical protein
MVATNHASSAWVEEVWVGDKEPPITVTEDGRVVAVQPPPPRRMPIKTRTVELTGDYAGWSATVRTNAPFSNFLQLSQLTGDDGQAALKALAEIYRLLPKLIFAWNFVDEEGTPLPCNAEGFAQLPAELLVMLIDAVNGAGADDPKG